MLEHSRTEHPLRAAVTAPMIASPPTRLLPLARRSRLAVALLLLSSAWASADPPGDHQTLKGPSEFASIALGEICRQLKDVNRNGGRDLASLQEHVAKDDIVAYGRNPGAGRVPAPGSQEAAGQLVQAWIDSGAECPP